ncbi:MAG: glycosyltransferase family 4 protein [Nitrospirae bacterium]|nr:glycosyltransferase family 4 protein [Nitrospirota bacterium]
MKIGIIWHCVYPWDVRIEKMIKVFLDAGHSVCLVCKGRNGLPAMEQEGQLTICRISLKKIKWPLFNKLISYPLFFNPFWFFTALKIMRRQKVDLLVVRDIPLSLMTSAVGKCLHIPTLLDMAENYPAALIAYQNPYYRPFLFGQGWLPKTYEKLAVKYIDHVFVVAEEQMTRLCNMGVPDSKITIIRNTPEMEFYLSKEGQLQTIFPDDKKLVNLLYVGKIDAHRGIELLIRALPNVMKKYSLIKLLIIGDGTERRRLIELSESLGIKDNVEFPGWIDIKEIPAIIKDSNICFIPHLRSEHTDTTIPNKIFDYMALGKPVVVSDCIPLRRIVEESNCGLVFKSGDVSDLTKAIITLLSTHNYETIGHNGKKAVISKYNWLNDSQNIIHAIGQFSV